MKKLFALLLTVVMMASMMVPAMAEEAPNIGGYDPITPATTTIPHSLTLTKPGTGLDYDITYSFEEVSAPVVVGATNNGVGTANLAVIEKPSIESITYGPSENDVFTAPDWTIEKTLEIDWSAVQIKEPGVYRWDVKQKYTTTAPEEATGMDRMIYLFMYVVDDGDGNLTETFAVATAINEDGTAKATAKPDKLPEEYPAQTLDLIVTKTIEGVQGSKEQYFPFSITLTIPGDIIKDVTFAVEATNKDPLSYDIDVPATAYHGVQKNPESVTVPYTSQTKTFTVWLKHNQSVTIRDLTYDTAYSITEGGNDGYTVTSKVSGDTVGISEGGKTASDTALTVDTTVAYTNSKELINPTGISLQSGIAFFGLVLAMGMMMLMFVGKRKEQN